MRMCNLVIVIRSKPLDEELFRLDEVGQKNKMNDTQQQQCRKQFEARYNCVDLHFNR